MSSSIDFISGCFGGMAGVLIGHPLDTIKVVMQTSQTKMSVSSVLRNYSIPSLYQGIKAPLCGLAVINSIVFGVHGSVMRTCPTTADSQQKFLWNGLAGSMAGMAQSVITSPVELLKIRSQISSKTIWDCYKTVWKNEGGIRGLYRGFWITVARDCPAFATYFLSFDWFYTNFQQQKQISTIDMLAAGGIAGALSWLVVYPLDVIKSRLQTDNRYSSFKECLMDTIHRDGIGALMRGCSPTLIRAFPTNAATFAVVTWTICSYNAYEERLKI